MVEWEACDLNAVGGKACGGGTTVDARERHKRAERERRKSMHELFLALHSLLPNAHAVRKEQSTILQEIINFIPLAVSRLSSLRTREVAARHAAVQLPLLGSDASSGGDCSIRFALDVSSTLSIRVRGDNVSVSLTDTRPVLISTFLDELDAHQLKLVRSSCCRDGSKLVHHSESKICNGIPHSPILVKARMQELAGKLLKLRKSSTKRAFDQLY